MYTIWLALLILDSTHAYHARVTLTPTACHFSGVPKGTPAPEHASLVTARGTFTITDWDKRECAQ